MNKPLYYKYGKKEIEWLSSRDKAMGKLMERMGKIKREVNPDLFSALVNSIIGQQISSKAHASVWIKMQERFTPLTPQKINSAPKEEIQSCGTSMRKAEYIKGIARAVLEKELDLEGLKKLSGEEIIEKLICLKGIGKWTIEMLMIFSMQRKDILSFGDLGIIRGMKILYKKDEITADFFEKCKKRYSPYASVASLYLWAISSE